MKRLFCLSLVVFASLFSGCMSNGSETIVLPEPGGGIFQNADIVFVSGNVPTGSTTIIKSVQFISNPAATGSGTLFVTSSQELSELYLQIEGKPGYYVRQLSEEDISYSGTGSYVYSVNLDFSPGLSAEQQQTAVSGKTTGETISGSVETANSSMKQLTCNDPSTSGGDAGYIGNVQMKQKSGSFMFQYDTYSVPDKITIYDGYDTRGNIVFTYSGGTSGNKSSTVNFNESIITVEVIGLEKGTSWKFLVNCP
jgi:hypothetical protein